MLRACLRTPTQPPLSPIIVHLSLSHLQHTQPTPPSLPSTSTHVHVRSIGARPAGSMLVNFRQDDTPSKGCARSQLLNIFTSADRFVFIIYHRSCSFSLRYAYTYCTPTRRLLFSPGQSLRRKSVRVSGLDQSLACFILVLTVAIAITLSLFEIGTYSYAIGGCERAISPCRHGGSQTS